MTDAPRPTTDSVPAPPTDGRPGISDYVLAMGHELRAPLNAVIGMSGLLLDGELSSRQRQYVRSIHAAGESLSTILADLLDLSRLLAGGLPIEPIPFDLRSMVEETAKVLSPRAEERNLALRVDWRPEIGRHVVGDPGRTRQVLANLVGHALNATSQGEVVIRVSADGEIDGLPVVRFSVEDTGVGIPADRVDRVFDQYVPVDASPYRSFGITGLGLRISAELVRSMNGEIGVSSEVDKGSRFWFRLPMPAAPAAPDRRLEPTTRAKDGRMLIVEADHASRRRLSDQLEDAGWSAAFADDLRVVYDQLLEAATGGSPFTACLLSDYAVRPVHAEIATRIKANETLASVALVILTAVGSPGEGKRLWHAGFAAYLRKPVPTEELHDALAALAQVSENGRGPALITRHSLAEVRNSAPADFAGIDEMLASLTAPETASALLIGATPAQQLDVTEALALAGLAVEMATTPEAALERLDRSSPAIVFVAGGAEWEPETFSRLREGLGASGDRRPIVAFAADPERKAALLAIGVDEVLLAPVGRTDLDRVVRRWTDQAIDRADAATSAGQLVLESEPVAIEPTSDAAPDQDAPFHAAVEEAEAAANLETEVTWVAETEAAADLETEIISVEETEAAADLDAEIISVEETEAAADRETEAAVPESVTPAELITDQEWETAAPTELALDAAPETVAPTELAGGAEWDTAEPTGLGIETAIEAAEPETAAELAAPETVTPAESILDAAPETVAPAELASNAEPDTGEPTDLGIDLATATPAEIETAVEPAEQTPLDLGIEVDPSLGFEARTPTEVDDSDPPLGLDRIETVEASQLEIEPTPGFEGADFSTPEDQESIAGFVGNEPGLDLADDAEVDSVDLAPPGAALAPEDDAAVAETPVLPPGVEIEPPSGLIRPPEIGPETPAGSSGGSSPTSASLVDQAGDLELERSEPVALLAPPAEPTPSEAAAEAEANAEPAVEPPTADRDPVAEADQEPLAGEETTDRPEVRYEVGTMSIILPSTEPTEASIRTPARGTAVTVEERPAERLPVVGEAIVEQLASGGGIFAQQVVGSFLRDAPQRISELATAASRRDVARMTQALQSLKAMGGLLSAAQLVDDCFTIEADVERGDLETAASRLGELEDAFLEVRAALEKAAPPGAAAPSELPPVSASFLDQLRPDRDPSSRALAEQLANTFRTEAPLRLSELKDAVIAEEAEKTQRLGQTLKGMCGLIGADAMAKLCALVEADARLRRVGQARRYLDQLVLELERVRDALSHAG
jgi:CheY-like chemotaxis protein/HPt (histidine-containing phosphotransfer) domain-containing protein